MAVKAVPEGWHTITPRLFAADAAKLVDFLKHAFEASGEFRNDSPSEIHIGDSIVMVGEAVCATRCPRSYIFTSTTRMALIIVR